MSDEMIAIRMGTIKIGLEAEMKGYRLTSKAPRCFKIIEIEFGIKAKRSAQGKRAAYEKFCERFGFMPKPEPGNDKGATNG